MSNGSDSSGNSVIEGFRYQVIRNKDPDVEAMIESYRIYLENMGNGAERTFGDCLREGSRMLRGV